MAVLPIIPYHPIADKAFGEVEIELTAAMFQNMVAVPGKSMFVFERCLFKKITIINDQVLPLDLIDLNFFDCFIENIEVKSAVSKNLGIFLYNSIIPRGSLQVGELRSVQLTNCFTDGFFIKNAGLVRIEYVEYTVYPLLWDSLLL